MVQTRSGGQTTGATKSNSTKPQQQQQQKKPQQRPKQTSTGNGTRSSKKQDNPTNNQNNSTESSSLDKKIHKIIADYGSLPLQDTDIANKQPLKPTPDTILALVLDAMLKSTRISHELAQKAVNTVIQAGYHDIQTLRQTTWDDRVAVLTEGGYNRYREQTATRLGELVELIDEEYSKESHSF
jgi:hypothetical protein